MGMFEELYEKESYIWHYEKSERFDKNIVKMLDALHLPGGRSRRTLKRETREMHKICRWNILIIQE